MTVQTASFPMQPAVPSATAPTRLRNFVFLSSCPGDWGGSEELWFEAALSLKSRGHRVSAIKSVVNFEHRRIKALQSAGIPIEDYDMYMEAKKTRILRRVLPGRWAPPHVDYKFNVLWKRLAEIRPDLIIISQGENFDAMHYVAACQAVGVRYILLSHKASDTSWPPDVIRNTFHRAYFEAARALFVSEHNRNHTELQVGMRLSNAEVVRNPFLTPVEEPVPWPEATELYKLACVGRLYTTEKGQDVLIRALAQDKWRERSIEISVFGEGTHKVMLERMTALLDVTNVKFVGFTWDVLEIWRTHHALVMPSRAEGLPLTLVEAMYCGRPAIVTNVGGNAEVIDEGLSGFISDSASVKQFDAALERAWVRRADWKQMGLEAARKIRTMIKPGAGETFALLIEKVCAE